jgi:hypothetical protein
MFYVSWCMGRWLEYFDSCVHKHWASWRVLEAYERSSVVLQQTSSSLCNGLLPYTPQAQPIISKHTQYMNIHTHTQYTIKTYQYTKTNYSWVTQTIKSLCQLGSNSDNKDYFLGCSLFCWTVGYLEYICRE